MRVIGGLGLNSLPVLLPPRPGIDLPDHLPDAGKVPPDDLLDAAAAAWTAWRLLQGTAKVLPESAGGCDRTLGAVIWY